jgi:Trk K+ transport system NAD-binding subunit
VVRDGRSFLPNGSTTLHPGDRAIVVTANQSILNLDDILAR